MASRAQNSIRNASTGAFGQALSIALNFVVRTVFIRVLGEYYAGINSALSGVLTILNLANLGVDVAIGYAMYKPAAEEDVPKLRSLLEFYHRAFITIGTVILVIGMALTPVIPALAKGVTDLKNLRYLYWLFLSDTVFSYWFMSYLSSILVVEQQRYVFIVVDYYTGTAQALLRIATLWFFRASPLTAFYIYTALGVVIKLLRNYLIRRQVIRRYPWVLDKHPLPLPAEEKKGIYKNMVGMLASNVCRVLNDSIDTVIISGILGVDVNGVFSNYLIIRTYVGQLLKTLLDPLTESVGNLCAVESREKKENFFYTLHFFCAWLFGWAAICFWILFNPFIAGVWLRDEKWLLSGTAVLLFSLNFLIEGLAKAVIIYRDANGLFWETRHRYTFSALLNAGLSVLLVGPAGLGVSGALLGTTVSVCLMISYDPVLVFRRVFERSPRRFYGIYLRDLGLILATGALTTVICLPFSAFTVRDFLLRLLACMVVPNGLWVLLFRRDERFSYLLGVVTGLAKKLLKKLK